MANFMKYFILFLLAACVLEVNSAELDISHVLDGHKMDTSQTIENIFIKEVTAVAQGTPCGESCVWLPCFIVPGCRTCRDSVCYF